MRIFSGSLKSLKYHLNMFSNLLEVIGIGREDRGISKVTGTELVGIYSDAVLLSKNNSSTGK